MIREWLRPDGNTMRFDTTTQTAEVVNASRENVVPVHPATDEERAEYFTYFPEATQEEINAKSVMAGQLTEALLALRNATIDNTITPLEFAGVNPLVQIALRSYRDFAYKDATIDRLAFLVLSQVSFAYSLLFMGASQANKTVMDTVLNFEIRISEVESRLAALENNS